MLHIWVYAPDQFSVHSGPVDTGPILMVELFSHGVENQILNEIENLLRRYKGSKSGAVFQPAQPRNPAHAGLA